MLGEYDAPFVLITWHYLIICIITPTVKVSSLILVVELHIELSMFRSRDVPFYQLLCIKCTPDFPLSILVLFTGDSMIQLIAMRVFHRNLCTTCILLYCYVSGGT